MSTTTTKKVAPPKKSPYKKRYRKTRNPDDKAKERFSKAKEEYTKAKKALKKDEPEQENQEDYEEPTLEDLKESDEASPDNNSGPIIVYNPTERQRAFLSASEDFVFYGGSRGGGKTYALIGDPLRWVDRPNFRGLFIRKTMKELRQVINHTRMLYPQAIPGARFLVSDSTWHFPSGATLEYGYADNLEDVQRYIGQSYQWIGIDELPHFATPEIPDLITSSARSADSSIPVQIRASGNPGAVGSWWVKERFIDPAPPDTPFKTTLNISLPDGTERKVSRTYRFIPSSLYDNPYLLHDDNYLATLASLDDVKKEQWLEGNWDIIDNSAFPGFRRKHHVIKPFVIPEEWPKFRAADWGYNTPFCVLWFAVGPDEEVYVYREYYGKEVFADDFAKKIVELEKKDRNIYDALIDGSTDINRGERGLSIYETINNVLASNKRLTFRKADRSDGSREAGKEEVNRRLALRPNGEKDDKGDPTLSPGLFIFEDCTNLIRTLPRLILDKDNPEKVSKKQEDHAYDALHYGLRSRPIPMEYFKTMIQESVYDQKKDIVDPIFGY